MKEHKAVLSFNERYFNLIEDKKELKAHKIKVSDFFDDAQMYMSDYGLRALQLEMNNLQMQINQVNTQLDKMRVGLTSEDLQKMKKEYEIWLAALQNG